MPSLEDVVVTKPERLTNRIQNYCQERKNKGEQEWKSHKVALKEMKESKEQQLL